MLCHNVVCTSVLYVVHFGAVRLTNEPLPRACSARTCTVQDPPIVCSKQTAAVVAAVCRTPGPAETMSPESVRKQPGVAQDYPHSDQARAEGERKYAQDPKALESSD